jgi:hypothetical protein
MIISVGIHELVAYDRRLLDVDFRKLRDKRAWRGSRKLKKFGFAMQRHGFGRGPWWTQLQFLKEERASMAVVQRSIECWILSTMEAGLEFDCLACKKMKIICSAVMRGRDSELWIGMSITAVTRPQPLTDRWLSDMIKASSLKKAKSIEAGEDW